MNNSRFQMTSKQLIFFFLGTMIATGILSLPRVASKDSGPDAWIAVLIGALIPLLSLIMIERLCRKFPDKGFIDLSIELFGRYPGGFLVILFIVYGLFFSAVVVRLFAEITTLYMLPRTPQYVIVVLLILGIAYVTAKGAKVVGRINELVFYMFLLLLLLALPALTVSDITNLLPVGDSGITAILTSSLSTSWAFAGVEILFVVYSMTTRHEEVIKAGLTALIIAAALYLIVTVVCLAAYGTDLMQQVLFPTLGLLKIVDFPLIHRLEFFFLAFWLGLGARPLMNYSLATSFTCTGFLGLDINKHYPLIVIIIMLITGIIAEIPRNSLQVLQWSTYAGYAFLIVALGYPILYHLALLIYKGRNAHA